MPVLDVYKIGGVGTVAVGKVLYGSVSDHTQLKLAQLKEVISVGTI